MTNSELKFLIKQVINECLTENLRPNKAGEELLKSITAANVDIDKLLQSKLSDRNVSVALINTKEILKKLEAIVQANLTVVNYNQILKAKVHINDYYKSIIKSTSDLKSKVDPSIIQSLLSVLYATKQFFSTLISTDSSASNN